MQVKKSTTFRQEVEVSRNITSAGPRSVLLPTCGQSAGLVVSPKLTRSAYRVLSALQRDGSN